MLASSAENTDAAWWLHWVKNFIRKKNFEVVGSQNNIIYLQKSHFSFIPFFLWKKPCESVNSNVSWSRRRALQRSCRMLSASWRSSSSGGSRATVQTSSQGNKRCELGWGFLGGADSGGRSVLEESHIVGESGQLLLVWNQRDRRRICKREEGRVGGWGWDDGGGEMEGDLSQGEGPSPGNSHPPSQLRAHVFYYPRLPSHRLWPHGRNIQPWPPAWLQTGEIFHQSEIRFAATVWTSNASREVPMCAADARGLERASHFQHESLNKSILFEAESFKLIRSHVTKV